MNCFKLTLFLKILNIKKIHLNNLVFSKCNCPSDLIQTKYKIIYPGNSSCSNKNLYLATFSR